MEELIKSLKSISKASNLRSAWSEASEYPIADVDWTPAQKYVSMLERKVIEQSETIEILEEKIKALDSMRKLWAKGEIEN